MKLYSILLLTLLLTACTTTSIREAFTPSLPDGYELPASSPSDHIVKRKAYTISFDDKRHVARWVAYRLTREGVVSEANQRKGVTWKVDPDFEAAITADYANSGFDKGHMAPAEDFEIDKVAMAESFFYGNAIPQPPSFNREMRLLCCS